MKKNEVTEAKCPVCGMKVDIDRADLGVLIECPSCRQKVMWTPPSPARLRFRKVAFWIGVVVIVMGAVWLYEARVSETTKLLSGPELPDASAR